MSNDLKAIKKEIYEKNLICHLLESVGCHNLKENDKEVFGSRPDGDHPRGFSVYLDENLFCNLWTKNVPVSDIFDLISYFKFGKTTEFELEKNLYRSKQYIIQTLNLKGYKKNKIKEIPDYNFHLRGIKKKNKKEKNKVIDEKIKSEFVFIPHKNLIDEGLDYNLLNEFEIGFDILTERIVFTYRNKNGELIGFRGRATRKEEEQYSKYLPIYNFSKSLELYNLHRAYKYILESKEVLMFEGEKSTILSTMYGYPNAVAFMGSAISEEQAKLVKVIHPDVKFIVCMDKDRNTEDIKKAVQYLPKKRTYAIFDTKNLLNDKQAPVDAGKEIFDKLYINHCYRVFPE